MKTIMVAIEERKCMLNKCPVCRQSYYAGIIENENLAVELCSFLRDRIVLGGNTHERVKAMVFMFAELHGIDCYLEFSLKLPDTKARRGFRLTRIDAVYLQDKKPILVIEIDRTAKKRNLAKMMQIDCDRLWIDVSRRIGKKKKNPIPKTLDGVTTFKLFC